MFFLCIFFGKAKRRQSTESNDSATKQEKKKHAGDREGDRRGGDRGDRGGRGERGKYSFF